MEKVYCDTNPWLDLILNRGGRWISYADGMLNFLRKVREGEYVLVYSDWVIEEFAKYAEKKELLDIIDELGEKAMKVSITKKERQKARSYGKNYPDALHAVLAMKAEAKILTTRNLSDFEPFKDELEIILPEHL